MAENVKTVQGLAIASVKTLQGLAIASVQTINGVDNTAGGPTLVASDNFGAYAHGVNLDTAADWVVEAGTINVHDEGGGIHSIAAGASAVGLYRHVATFAANQRAEMTITAAAAGGAFDLIGPAVRVQTGAATGYGAIFSAGDLYLVSFNAGTQATINSDTGMTLAPGDRIAIEANGSGASTRLKVQVDTGGGWSDKWTDQNPAVDIDGGACGVCNWLLTGANRATDWNGYDL